MREIQNHPVTLRECGSGKRCKVTRPTMMRAKVMPIRLSCLFVACLALAGCWSAGPAPNPPAGSYQAQDFEVGIAGGAEHVKGAAVSDEFFAAGKIRPMLGRTILADEHRSMHVVVISNRLWTDKFRADPAVIGRTVQVNGENVTIVGVMPRDFSIPQGAQLWVPLPAR